MRPLFLRLRLAVFLIALWQLGLPVAAYGRMASDGGLTQEICTPQGTKKVVIDADGQAHDVQLDANPSHDKHCSWCAASASVPLATLIDWHFGEPFRNAFRLGATCVQSPAALILPPATGPPAKL